MKALVIGSTGLIGRQLVQELLKQGHNVVGASRDSEKSSVISGAYQHIGIDVTRKEDFTKLPRSVDWVFNTSGYVPRARTTEESIKCMMINAIGVQNLLEYMHEHKIKRLIHSSSVTVYGVPPNGVADEKNPLNPVLSYGVSKVAAENFCAMYEKLYGLEITLLRYSPIYGQGLNQRTAFTIFVEKAMKNESITLFQKGERYQDYVYVQDVVQSNILAAEKNILGAFNIASGETTSMRKLAETIISTFNSRSEITYDASQEEEFSIGIDISKARKQLGYQPNYTLEKGLAEYRESLAV